MDGTINLVQTNKISGHAGEKICSSLLSESQLMFQPRNVWWDQDEIIASLL